MQSAEKWTSGQASVHLVKIIIIVLALSTRAWHKPVIKLYNTNCRSALHLEKWSDPIILQWRTLKGGDFMLRKPWRNSLKTKQNNYSKKVNKILDNDTKEKSLSLYSNLFSQILFNFLSSKMSPVKCAVSEHNPCY